MKLISIVIPCYNSEATIRKVVEMVMEEFKKMDGYDCEFVLVNDGSPKDNTYGEIKKLGEQYQNVKVATPKKLKLPLHRHTLPYRHVSRNCLNSAFLI